MSQGNETPPYRPTKVLITGALGQDGAYLSELALSQGCTVVGGVRDAVHAAGSDRAWRLRHLGIEQRLTWAEFDLRRADSIAAALQAHRPDVIFNLAAQSSGRTLLRHCCRDH